MKRVKWFCGLCSILLCAVVVLSACGAGAEQGNGNNDASIDYVMTDEDLVDRALYLFDNHVLPVHWWRGAGYDLFLGVNDYEWVEPLADTPEYTTFYQVFRFHSIEEMKRATEQVMTKKYAEDNLYPIQEEYNQFLERDGELYVNTSFASGAPPFKAVEATVLSKSENEALLSVVFREDTYGEEQVHEIELKRENGIWKLNNYPFS